MQNSDGRTTGSSKSNFNRSNHPNPDPSCQGVDAELVSLESIVEVSGDEDELSTSTDGQPQLGQLFYDRLSKRLGERLAECGNRVPVVTGKFLQKI